MTKTRLRYWLKALMTPSSWTPIYKRDKVLDKWLWDRMEEGYELYPHNPLKGVSDTYVSKAEAEFGGKVFWIENAPYANGQPVPGHGKKQSIIPRAPTRIRFAELTAKARAEGRIPYFDESGDFKP